jgi:hypothetical protein
MKNLGWSEKRADALMAKIWDEGEYPVWQAFVRRIRENN